jgi:hypothetical protein
LRQETFLWLLDQCTGYLLMALPFIAPSQSRNPWIFVDLASSFPNITESGSVTLSEEQPCTSDNPGKQGCRVFLGPESDVDGDSKKAVPISHNPKDQTNASLRRGQQVLVFQYSGKFHAIDNVRAVTPPCRQVLLAQALTLAEMPSLFVPAL